MADKTYVVVGSLYRRRTDDQKVGTPPVIESFPRGSEVKVSDEEAARVGARMLKLKSEVKQEAKDEQERAEDQSQPEQPPAAQTGQVEVNTNK